MDATSLSTLAALIQAGGTFSVPLSIYIYYKQTKTQRELAEQHLVRQRELESTQRQIALQSEQQANRSRLTEAYLNVNSFVLNNEDTISVSSNFFRRGHESFNKKINPKETAIAIEILHLKLNALFLEWNYRKTYDIPVKLEDGSTTFSEFERTFKGTMIGFATNGDKNSQQIIANLSEIFPGFSSDFMHRANKIFEELNPSIQRDESLNLRFLGDTAAGIKWLEDDENTRNAKHIYNTVFYRFAADDALTASTVNIHVPNVSNAIKKLLSKKCGWEDIYTEDQVSTLKILAESLTAAQRPYYSSRKITPGVVSPDFPLLQVILITYWHGPSTVLLGWTFRGARSDKVFESSGDETVGYFMDYLKTLEGNSRPETLWNVN